MSKLRHREVKTAGKLLSGNKQSDFMIGIFHCWTVTAVAESFSTPDAMLKFYTALFNTKQKKKKNSVDITIMSIGKPKQQIQQDL